MRNRSPNAFGRNSSSAELKGTMKPETAKITFAALDDLIESNKHKVDLMSQGYVIGVAHARKLLEQAVEHEERIAKLEQTASL